ncbi:lysozyme [Haemophilus sputorum]|uniref:Lysozyme n=1 Tax=Haemophilus sputorum TaxID=1078480 RepID=A0A369YEE7_9PAST|nr:lysozyme [Haemophilus sputorum]RDE73081.1 lysozyme [Haemophilus sputorum]
MSKSMKIGAIACSIVGIIATVVQYYPHQIRTTEKGLAIIGNAEGCRRDPYKCPADVLTVGIGSTQASGQKINPNRIYTDKEIAERWVEDLKIAEQCVNRYANGKKLPQGAFEAVTSLTFNVGCSNMQKSTLYRLANAGRIQEMCDQFPRWIYSGGKRLKGLVSRRAAERKLCLTGLNK